VQREVFGRQLELAADRHLPVLVHDREAHADVTEALLGWTGRPAHRARGILHAFSGDAAMALRLADAGFLISFALPVAFRSAAGARAAAERLFDGSFVVETDAPYLGPEAGGRNEPTTALRVVAELARLRRTEPEGLVEPMRTAYDVLMASVGG
jgi:TatD DNase family protein